jgi:hypothetical protein
MTAVETIKTLSIGKGARAVLQVRKFSPELLTGVGVVGVVAAGILASRATLKLEPIVNDLEIKRELIKGAGATNGKTEHEVKKELTKSYVNSSMQVVKLYTPSVVIGAASITAILGAHGIMKKRNVALAGALKISSDMVERYRAKFIEEHSEEEDREFRLNLRAQETEDESGEKTIAMALDPDIGVSGYARIFDRDNVNWDRRPEYNIMWLKTHQSYANDRLKAHGHIFLNEVYDMLGFPHSKEGALVGWVWQGDGDNYVDFGIFEFNNIRAGALADGTEGHVMLDFNVDGPIWDKI